MAPPERAPWEEESARPSQPSQAGGGWQQPVQPAPAWQPPPSQGFKLFPTDRRRQILVIVLLVVLFVVGPMIFFAERQLRAHNREKLIEEQQQQNTSLTATQQQLATEMLERAVGQLRATNAHLGPGETVSNFRKAIDKGEWQTEHYKITQISIAGRAEKSYDVIIYCMPKPGAEDQNAAGTVKFFWDSVETPVVWR